MRNLGTISADECIRSTCVDMLMGDYITTDKDKSYEVLYYQTGMTNPLARIMTHEARPLNIVTAVARFVWLIAGNNRVEDIAFYEPKVRGFSDDGLVVPGSDYGQRLFQPRPGLDQIQGVIDRLKANPGSRQAAAVVWQPEDAVRNSRDIPCTHGMFFHVRYGELQACVTMRSNHAFRILPFNLFEFTMLQEMIASEIKVPVGHYTHWAASMHVYDNPGEMPKIQQLVDSDPGESIVMPPMGDDAYSQAREVCRLEAQLRHACSASELHRIMIDASALNNYWLEIFGVLFCWNAAKRNLDPYYSAVHEDLRELVWTACQKASE